jgi:PAS domain S-box-containing protein
LAASAAGTGIFELDLQRREVFIDPILKSILGYENRELPGELDDWERLFHPDDLPIAVEKAEACMAAQAPRFEVECRMLAGGGEIRWLLARGQAFRDRTGTVLKLAGAAIDITERKSQEEALLNSKKRLEGILNVAEDSIISMDAESRITMFNQGAEKMFGFAADEVMGQPVEMLLPTRFMESHRGYVKEFVESAIPSRRMGEGREVFGRRKDGSEFPAEASISQLTVAGEHVFTVILRDVTEPRQTERSLEQALAEVQQLKDRLAAENVYLQEAVKGAQDFGEIVGRSEALKKVMRQAQQVAPLDTTVLITGETGTGKELLAHAIHNMSTRRAHTLVKVNCATLPSELIESELFGHEKGAYTGAHARRVGRFEIANGGTIFLDEIGELPLDLQAKLLRVIQEAEFERLGSSRTIKVDVRVIAATNRNLEEAVLKGLFRSDLYYRLSIFPMRMPSLRERQDDIPMLVMHFVRQLGLKLGKEIESIPPETMEALQNYSWPGNIRELRNVIERAAIITQGTRLRLLDSLEATPLARPASAAAAPPGELAHQSDTLEESQRHMIVETLDKTYWRIEGPNGAAALLGIHPNTLRSRMKKLGISKPRFKDE